MELDFETLRQIVAMLPPEWQRHVVTFCVVSTAVSSQLFWIKPLAARVFTSPSARAWADAIIKLFDWVAFNSRGMDLRPMAEPKTKKGRKP